MARLISSILVSACLIAAWGSLAAEQPAQDKLDELVRDLEARDATIEHIEVTDDGSLIVHRRYTATGSRIRRQHVQKLDPDDLKAMDYAIEHVVLSLPYPVRAHTRDQLLRHGDTDLARALSRQDPSIWVDR